MLNQKTIQNIIQTFDTPTLTLYLRVDPAIQENQSQTPAWNIWLKNALNDIQNNLDKSHTSIWETIATRLDNHFNVYQPGGRTLVIFMDENNEFIRELPLTLENHAHFGKPLVTPLLWAIDEYQEYMIVMVDKERAVFRKAYLGNLETETEMNIDLEYDWGEKTLMPAADADGQALRQGNNREAFDDMLNAHRKRFYQDIADEIQQNFKTKQPMRLIIGGDERAAHELEDKLHSSVADYLVSILPIPMDADDKEIMQRMWQTAYNYERNYEFDLIDNVISMAHANGRGVIGRDDLKTAMQMQQVETIIMPYALLQDDTDYAQEVTLWALHNNSQIEFVHGTAARKLSNKGDIAARLYYAIETV